MVPWAARRDQVENIKKIGKAEKKMSLAAGVPSAPSRHPKSRAWRLTSWEIFRKPGFFCPGTNAKRNFRA